MATAHLCRVGGSELAEVSFVKRVIDRFLAHVPLVLFCILFANHLVDHFLRIEKES